MNSDSKESNNIKKNPKRISKNREKEMQERLIQISRVSKVTKGGKKVKL